MKKLLCLLLTLLLIHPALAEDALDAPDAASLLSCAEKREDGSAVTCSSAIMKKASSSYRLPPVPILQESAGSCKCFGRQDWK